MFDVNQPNEVEINLVLRVLRLFGQQVQTNLSPRVLGKSQSCTQSPRTSWAMGGHLPEDEWSPTADRGARDGEIPDTIWCPQLYFNGKIFHTPRWFTWLHTNIQYH